MAKVGAGRPEAPALAPQSRAPYCREAMTAFHDPPSETATPLWRRPLVRSRPEDRSSDTLQTPGMRRYAAISGGLTGSQHLWMGGNTVHPGQKSADHHHGEADSGIYIDLRRRSPASCSWSTAGRSTSTPLPATLSTCRRGRCNPQAAGNPVVLRGRRRRACPQQFPEGDASSTCPALWVGGRDPENHLRYWMATSKLCRTRWAAKTGRAPVTVPGQRVTEMSFRVRRQPRPPRPTRAGGTAAPCR